jgi:hypothetical protein
MEVKPKQKLRRRLGSNKFEIMQRCRRKHKLLPSSTFCRGIGNLVWTNVFRVEEDFEINTGKCK